MWKNFLKIAYRNILRHKGYSFINIAGLAIGMACCIVIMLWVLDELSYDKYHANADRIYRLWVDANFGAPFRTALSMAPAASALVEEYPEVLATARIGSPGSISISYGDNLIQERGVAWADNSIFDVFTLPFVSGDPETALKLANTLVITEEMAEKYFADEDPLGKVLRLGGSDNYTVTGVIRNVPHNSHVTFNMLRSMETLTVRNRADMEHWFNIQYYTYLLLAEGVNFKDFEAKLSEFVDRHMGEILTASGGTLDCYLQPLTDIHLRSHLQGELGANGDITYVYLFTLIALFILLIACVNFINLATARSTARAREVGMRRTLGANRIRLIVQFLGESVLFCLLSLLISFIIIEISLPFFNDLAARELTLNLLNPPWIMAGFFGFAILVGCLAGVYPALFLSSFKPVKVLKGSFETGTARSRFRGLLVVLQFTISIALIVSTLTIYHQIQYMKHKNLGFDREQVVVMPRLTPSLRQSLDTVKDRIAAVPGVIDVAASTFAPGRGYRLSIVQPEGFADDQPQTLSYLEIDHNYLPTYKMNLLEGRNFKKEFSTDPAQSVLINQTAARQFGWDDPVGKTMSNATLTDSGRVQLTRTVIGVVADFHQRSLHNKIAPLVIGNIPVEFWTLSVRIAPENVSAILDEIEEAWKGFDPNRPFSFYFLDEAIDARYRSEERLGNITLIFSLLAIFIGCLGLVGMSAYTAEQRTKEIGIRKVLGASITAIVRLLSVRFLVFIAVANVIAWPVAYYAMHRWLENFAYRVNPQPWIFLLSMLLALTIAMITVSFQAVRAATVDPVKSLRYE
jgi:putative ABC transport system permease protein